MNHNKEIISFLIGLAMGIASMFILVKSNKSEEEQKEKAGNNIRVIKTWVEQPYNVKCYYLVVDNDTVVGVKQYND